MAPLMAALSEADRDAIIRLDDVVERPSAALQLNCLEKALGPELFREFRTTEETLV